MNYTTLTAMFTPALFLLATASFATSIANRMSRVVDRFRVLNDLSDSICRGETNFDFRPERIQHIEDQLTRLDTRSHLIRYALTLSYVANGCFVGTSLALALDVQLGHRIPFLPTMLAVIGAMFLLGANGILLREATLALRSSKDESSFHRDLQHKRRQLKGMPEV